MAAPKLLTVDDWVEIEQRTGVRHEFYRGRVVAMAGGTPRHSMVSGGVYGVLFTRLRGSSCQAFTSDQAVEVESGNRYFYPDASVACDPVFAGAPDYSLQNPVLVVEVLSPTTERDDRGPKFEGYRGVESLQAIVLVSTEKPHVELYTRENGRWVLEDFRGLEAVAQLPVAGIELPLAEVYERVDFSAPAEPAG